MQITIKICEKRYINLRIPLHREPVKNIITGIAKIIQIAIRCTVIHCLCIRVAAGAEITDYDGVAHICANRLRKANKGQQQHAY